MQLIAIPVHCCCYLLSYSVVIKVNNHKMDKYQSRGIYLNIKLLSILMTYTRDYLLDINYKKQNYHKTNKYFQKI